MKIFNQLKLKPLQRLLRKNSTDAERKIWKIARNRQVLGLKFFRQYGVGNYILDFYCPQIKLAIEIDGEQHNKPDNANKDDTRTKYLKNLNIFVLRFWNNDVLQNLSGIYDKTLKTAKELLPASSLNKEEE